MCLHIIALRAQTSDVQARLGLRVKQDLPKGFEVAFTFQPRLDHQLAAFGGGYTYGDIGYAVNKRLSAIGELRYATSTSWDKFRFGGGFIWKDKLMKKTEYQIKMQYQRELYLQSWSEIGQYPDRNNVRLKLGIERKLDKHLILHISCEPQVRVAARMGGLQRVRNLIGINWEFVKNQHIDLAYFYQPEFASGHLANTNHVLVLNYSLQLGKWWKKKDDD